MAKGKDSIHINPANRGKLTAEAAKIGGVKNGKVTAKAEAKLAKSPDPAVRKRAIFAENARSWQGGKKK